MAEVMQTIPDVRHPQATSQPGREPAGRTLGEGQAEQKPSGGQIQAGCPTAMASLLQLDRLRRSDPALAERLFEAAVARTKPPIPPSSEGERDVASEEEVDDLAMAAKYAQL